MQVVAEDIFKIDGRSMCKFLFCNIVNSILTLIIIKIIGDFLSKSEVERSFFVDGLFFFSCVLLSYFLNIYVNNLVVRYVYTRMYEAEVLLTNMTLNMSLDKLETVGKERISNSFEDIRSFVYLPTIIINFVNSIVITAVGFILLISQSIRASVSIIAIAIALITIYILFTKKLSKLLAKLKGNNDIFSLYVSDIFGGFKNFKLNPKDISRIQNDFIKRNRDDSLGIDIHLGKRYHLVNSINQYGIYVLIGLIIFFMPLVGFLKNEEVFIFIFTLLFISGPINRLLVLQNTIQRLRVSYTRVKSVFSHIKSLKRAPLDYSNVDVSDNNIQEFQCIDFKGVSYKYSDFYLHPIDLKIKRGEVLFIVGGNGSGKSTFLNLLTGLSEPLDGEIEVMSNIKITHQEFCQSYIAAVFADSYITKFNYSSYVLQKNHNYSKWLTFFKMDSVVQNDTEEAARRPFSKGQSKRMSLILALMECKPILILDEWAADQDPEFRKYFYEEIIPFLKSKGKTIVAVSHDDKYFKVADRIIKFEEGKVVNCRSFKE